MNVVCKWVHKEGLKILLANSFCKQGLQTGLANKVRKQDPQKGSANWVSKQGLQTKSTSRVHKQQSAGPQTGSYPLTLKFDYFLLELPLFAQIYAGPV